MPLQSPRDELSQLYSRLHRPKPHYETAAIKGGFECTLFLGPLPEDAGDADDGGSSEFSGQGRTKKLAEAAAAAAAVARLEGYLAAYRAKLKPAVQEALGNVVATTLGPKRAGGPRSELKSHHRDAEVHAYVMLAHHYLGSWLPLSALCQSRLLQAWYKANVLDAAALTALMSDRAAWVDDLRQRLAAEVPQAAGGALFELSADGFSVRPAPAAAAAAAAGTAADALILHDEAADLAAMEALESVLVQAAATAASAVEEERDGPTAVAVLVPANASLPLREVHVPAEGCLLSRLADVFGVEANRLLLWGRVGRPVQYLADPRASEEEEGLEKEESATHAEDGAPMAAVAPYMEPADQGYAYMEPVDQGYAYLEPADQGYAGAALPPMGRLDSTTTLVVHNGPAAMDWAAGRTQGDQAMVEGLLSAAPRDAADEERPQTWTPPALLPVGQARGAPRRSGAVDQGHGASKGSQADAGKWTGRVVRLSEPSMYSVLPLPSLGNSTGSSTNTAAGGDTGAADLNVRASWLAGGPVRGDALFSVCRLKSCLPPCTRWRSFTVADWWRTASALFPTVVHAAEPGSALVLRMPTTFSSSKRWFGHAPTKLLEAYAQHHAWRVEGPTWGPGAPSAVAGSGTADHIEPVRASMRVTGAGGATCVLEALSECSAPGAMSTEAPRERAALRLLYLLHAVDAAALRSGLQAATEGPVLGPASDGAASLEHATAPLPGDVTAGSAAAAAAAAAVAVACRRAGPEVLVVDPGQGDASTHPHDGCTVKVSFSISLPSHAVQHEGGAAESSPPQHAALNAAAAALLQTGSATRSSRATPCAHHLLHCGTLTFELATGAVVAPLEAAVRAVSVGGTATCRLDVPLEGYDPLGAFTPLRCALRVTLLKVAFPSPPLGCQGCVVEQPLSDPKVDRQQQRGGEGHWELVADVAQRVGARCLVVIGYAAGGMLEHLVKTCAHIAPAPAVPRGAGVDGDSNAGSAAAASEPAGQAPLADPPPAAQPPLAGRTLRHTVGLDDSAVLTKSVAKHFGRRMEAVSAAAYAQVVPTADGAKPPAAPALGVVKVSLLQGNSLDGAMAAPAAWGGLAGCDLATFIDRVQHLDPVTLSQVGPSLLGGLQPRVLVVTTPIWEHNTATHAAQLIAGTEHGSQGGRPVGLGHTVPSRLDGVPLRDGAHRSEWDRSQFEVWATQLAREFRYNVSFQDVGQLADEAVAPASSPVYCSHRQPGSLSQAAIFVRVASATPLADASADPALSEAASVEDTETHSLRAAASAPDATLVQPAAVAAAAAAAAAVATAAAAVAAEVLPPHGRTGGVEEDAGEHPRPAAGGPLRRLWGPRSVKVALGWPSSHKRPFTACFESSAGGNDGNGAGEAAAGAARPAGVSSEAGAGPGPAARDNCAPPLSKVARCYTDTPAARLSEVSVKEAEAAAALTTEHLSAEPCV